MAGGFGDSPGKRVVREQWNTPLLQRISQELGVQYLYLGLPGKDILDILQWRSMIRRIIAFEMENEGGEDRRRDLTEMQRKLALIAIPHDVYCGYIEHVVLFGEDLDGKPYRQDEFVTLYNLDFCNAITGKVPTTEGPRKCLRFLALKRLLQFQCDESVARLGDKFIVLLTCRDEFHLNAMNDLFCDTGQPQDLKAWLDQSVQISPLRSKHFQTNTPLLKAFVLATFRTYARGLSIGTCFLPMVYYSGKTRQSQMLHFTILCRLAPIESPLPTREQPADDFLRHVSLTTDGKRLLPCSLGPMETNDGCQDPYESALKFLA